MQSSLEVRASTVSADATEPPPAHDPLTPADRYQELFTDVQLQRVFDDSKTFVDCAPRAEPAAILDAYRTQRTQDGFDLRAFVHAHFDPPRAPREQYVSDPQQTLAEHIDGLWPVLTRHPAEHPRHASLLDLPHAYVVPGGRFGELYYWDSYFTMLGLAASGHHRLLRDMVDNFAYLIDTYGHVPNGTRSYYLSRSHPPMFVFMLDVLAEIEPDCRARYLPQLRREHEFWMRGEAELACGEQHRHLVRLADGGLLNRYWDERATPREESYCEDVATARDSPRVPQEIYRDLRAAAASGWDFSSRWIGDGHGGLCSTRTTAILPVDLNSFLFRLESAIASLAQGAGDAGVERQFADRALARQHAIHRWMWSSVEQAFFDYDWQLERARTSLTAATVAPLFAGLASAAQAAALAGTLRSRLLAEGGLATTERLTDEQWDQPNGWAPLQWLAIAGLRAYGETALAAEIAERWLSTVARLYRRDCKLVEKYRIHGDCYREPGGGGGGEYPLQDGFGWTNGVVRRLLVDYPQHEARAARAGQA